MLQTQELQINIGPQHPSTHGVFRMIVTVDGETIVDLKPVFGYLHRNHEQLAEVSTYIQSMPYTDRLDYFNSMANNHALALAVEKLAGISVPQRAEYIRVLMVELTRILNHASAVGFLLNDMGAWQTPLMFGMREREKILDLFEMASGARMMCNYFRFGGVWRDLPPEFMPQLKELMQGLPSFFDEFERLLKENEILLSRTINVGVLPKEVAVSYSVTGPVLRASGIPYDVRRAEPYSVYNELDFDIPIGSVGDVYDRFLIRIEEMRQSYRILQQVIERLPDTTGGHINPAMANIGKQKALRPPPGDAYARIESPKGELGFYLVSDGSERPYRYKVRAPSFINLTPLGDMCRGHKVADVVVILGSIDIVMGEVDR
ncbi:MAG: NADH-quinone oxidoreductase subunit D [Roseiflexus sp.]|jgi:NADH-quinone oxidoreductase subunit D|uniref:NADH-quinone oxidoreductase subunit D n=1 Tax=Roseiflexus sp. TaxID=2562120 RepID=UPI001B0F278F|nr:NADH-quinone oxidoreductase subunit D [Roseiflexus sp.]MBO9343125.1 NADH-quinone oxidoreductase subunit D [Roseiflexus sp.]MCL6541196.1 NADH-quinone oxidoreductase subunit D [Roseiflexus sp.]